MGKRNPNHPRKNSSTVVEPIRNLEVIDQIKDRLAGRPRDLLLFVMAINTGIRCGDLLRLTVGEVRGKVAGDQIVIREAKTGKRNVLAINESVHRALTSFLASSHHADGSMLFRSRKGDNRPLTICAVNRLVKDWCRLAGLEGNFGAHSLRKTFGYVQRVHFGVGFEVLCRRFNHSSPSVTMRYLGINDAEVIDILHNEI